MGRAWGGDVSGFFKELVLVGLEQRALGENDGGKAGEKIEIPVRTLNTRNMHVKMYS